MSEYPYISVEFEKSIQSYTLYYNYSEKQKTIIKSEGNFVRHKNKKIISLVCEELNEIKILDIDENGNFQENGKNTLVYNCLLNKEIFKKHKVLRKFPIKSFLRPVMYDLLIAFDIKFVIELSNIFEKQNTEKIDEVLENKIKLIGSNLENLSVGEWREQLEMYNEAHNWIKGIFGIHDFIEYMNYFDEKPDEFKDYIFRTKLNHDIRSIAGVTSINKLDNEYYSTQIGSRWKNYIDQIPEEIISLIIEFGEAIGSKCFLLFCLMNKKTPLYFATKIINLHQFFPVDNEDIHEFSTKELSINKLSLIYNRIVQYLSETLKEKKAEIKYTKYLNNDQSCELIINTNDLEINFDQKNSTYKVCFKDNNQDTRFLNYLKNLLVKNSNKKFIEKLLLQVKQDKTITINKDNCISGFDSHEASIYALEQMFLNKNKHSTILIKDSPLFFPNLIEDIFLRFGVFTFIGPLSHVMRKTRNLEHISSYEIIKLKINEYLNVEVDEKKGAYIADKIHVELFIDNFSEIGVWVNSIFKIDKIYDVTIINNYSDNPDYSYLTKPSEDLNQDYENVLKTNYGSLWKDFTDKLPEEIATLSHFLKIKYDTLLIPLYCLLYNKSPHFFADNLFKLNKFIHGEDSLYENNYSEYYNTYERIQTYLNVTKNEELEEIKSLKESINLEFKTSFNIPFKGFPEHIVVNNQKIYKLGNTTFKSHNEIKKFIQTQSLKAITAFLNTKGGKLIIGINENKGINEIVSISNDDYDNDDKYIRNIIQLISNRIGKKFCSEFINIKIKNIQDDKICIVDVQPYHPVAGEIPAYLDEKELYIRTGPRNDKVTDGAETAKFIIERMSKN